MNKICFFKNEEGSHLSHAAGPGVPGSMGFWVFLPSPIELLWRGGNTFESRSLDDPSIRWNASKEGTIFLKTNLWVQCPKPWKLLVRSPSNQVQTTFIIPEYILECESPSLVHLPLRFYRKEHWVTIEPDAPIAQLIPIHPDAIGRWEIIPASDQLPESAASPGH